MKLKLLIALAITLLACPLYAKDLGVDITSATTDGTVAARARQVTFIFRSTFVGTISGVAFSGGSGNDAGLTIKAPAGDTMLSIPYTISAGTLIIVRLQ